MGKVKVGASKNKSKAGKHTRLKIQGGGPRKEKKKWPMKKSETPAVSQIKQNVSKGTSKRKYEAPKTVTLREKMMARLNAARFRQLNEELDSTSTDDPKSAFKSQPQMFQKYHEAYRERKERWEVDPLDLIISWVKKNFPPPKVIADFGCGDARLAQSVPNTVHSYDLFALNDRVTACDMSNCPLKDCSVDVAIYCLSLMGTNVGKYLAEANRVLKNRGILKVAEVASRFQEMNPGTFMQKMKRFGFLPLNTDKADADQQNGAQANDVFYMFEFRKVRPVRLVNGKPPALKLNPCLYKKR